MRESVVCTRKVNAGVLSIRTQCEPLNKLPQNCRESYSFRITKMVYAKIQRWMGLIFERSLAAAADSSPNPIFHEKTPNILLHLDH